MLHKIFLINIKNLNKLLKKKIDVDDESNNHEKY